ncbi:MAG: hypothetical protein R3D26_02335 [Cyanobacteriota/Melainabacteria group bacterium]
MVNRGAAPARRRLPRLRSPLKLLPNRLLRAKQRLLLIPAIRVVAAPAAVAVAAAVPAPIIAAATILLVASPKALRLNSRTITISSVD